MSELGDDWGILRLVGLLTGDVTLIAHVVDYVVATALGAAKVCLFIWFVIVW